jgi:hypothetical protein
MNLKVIKANMTEIATHDLNGDRMEILYSYNTPVAMRLLTSCGMEYHVTNKFWSNTTSKHINSWMPKDDRIEHDQEYFDTLCDGVPA